MNLRKLFFPLDKSSRHQPAMDGLRGLAVLFVLVAHAINQGLLTVPEGTFVSLGKLGVYLFFIISAYLLDKQIIQVFLRGEQGWSYWRYYISRRLLRIFPPFILALLVFRLMNEAGYKLAIGQWSDVWGHLMLGQGDSIFWSIPVEFCYYLVSPLLILFFVKVLKFKSTQTIGFLFLIVLATVLINSFWDLPRLSTLRHLGIFSLGTILAAFETLKPASFVRVSQSIWMADVFRIAAGILFALIGYGVDFEISNLHVPLGILWCAFLLASFHKGLWRSFLSLRVLRFIGNISYSLYLFHIPVLLWIKGFNTSGTGQLILFFLVSIALAALIHVLIERPFLSLVKREKN